MTTEALLFGYLMVACNVCARLGRSTSARTCAAGRLGSAFEMTRHALRVDANQSAIVAALEAAGATVEVIGLPVDLLVLIGGKFALFEVKTTTGKKNPKPNRKTALQERIFAKFAAGPICLVDSPESAVRHLRLI